MIWLVIPAYMVFPWSSLLVIRVWVVVFLVLSSSPLKIFFSILRVLKQDEATAFTWAVISSLLSIMILRFLACGLDVGRV